ncbi:MAG: hypothetical protein BWY25_02215 [Chloroflexi bacterium ADurb.Bin222]|nr:MAG: hypothetical protein BWY25_02215 [Chloroflexi bacterium ADurb.Bin222]
MAGSWLLEAGGWLLEAGCWKLEAGSWWLVAGCWKLVAGCWLLEAGCWLLEAGCWKLVAGSWLLEAGCWLLDGGRLRYHQAELGSTHGAGVGLSVKAAVGGVFVLGTTGVAEREDAHGSIGPVVGDVRDEGEARPAIRAVDEGVAVAPVGRIEQLPQAIGTSRHVRRDEHETSCLRLRMADLERRVAIRGDRCRLQRSDVRERGRLSAQPGEERRQRLRVGFGFDVHAAGVIQHPAAHAEPPRQVVHEGTETDPLHHAGDRNPQRPRRHIFRLHEIPSVAGRRYPSRSSTQASQAAIPSPVLAESGSTDAAGFSPHTSSVNFGRSKSR